MVCVTPLWVSRQPQKVVVGVSLNGVDFVLSPQLFEYFKMPIVTEAVPCIGPETGGTEVMLHGTGFVSSVPFMCTFLDETATSLLLPQPIITPAQYPSPTSIVCIAPPGQPSSKVTIKISLAGNQHTWGTGGVTFLYHPTLPVTSVEPAFGGGLEMVMVSTISDIEKIFDDLADDVYVDGVVGAAGNITCGFTGLPEGFVSMPAVWFNGAHVGCITPSITAAETLPMVVRVSISLNGIDFSEFFANFIYAQSISGGMPVLALSPPATPKEGGGQLILSFSDMLILPPVSEVLICRVSILGILSQSGEIPQNIEEGSSSNIQWDIESLAVRTTTQSPSLISCEVPAIPSSWKEMVGSANLILGGESSSRNGHFVDVEIIYGSSRLPITPSSRLTR